MMKFKRDLNKTREILENSFNEDRLEANKLWYGATRLTITLSSSFLLLSSAFFRTIFPGYNSFIELPKFLILSWLALFLAVITGIINEVDSTIFHGNNCRKKASELKEINTKLIQNITEDTAELPSSYLIDAPFFWGAASIDLFVLAVLCMWLSFFDKTVPTCMLIIIFFVGILLLTILNLYLLNKRKVYS